MLCSLLDSMCFFFFKQKTAYEMRISDWSSDVCSSDLRAHGATSLGEAPAKGWEHGRFGAPYLRDSLLAAGALCETLETATNWSNEIGRASCRERVCQYV